MDYVHHHDIRFDSLPFEAVNEQVIVLVALHDERQQQIVRNRVLEPLRVQRICKSDLIEYRTVHRVFELLAMLVQPLQASVRFLPITASFQLHHINVLNVRTLPFLQ